jgi:hypothetical protein
MKDTLISGVVNIIRITTLKDTERGLEQVKERAMLILTS